MYKSFILIVLFLLITVNAQDLYITGKVLDNNNSPMFGVIATLKGQGISDTTGADGIYILSKLSNDIKNQSSVSLNTIKYDNSRLWFPVLKKTQVSIKVYNLSGQNVFTALNRKLDPGNYSINPATGLSAQMYIVQLKIGNKVHNFKSPSLYDRGKPSLTRIGDNATISGGVFARLSQDDINDTLNLIKDNQVLSTTNISEWIDTLPDLFVIQRDIYGNLYLPMFFPDTISLIQANITGDDINGTKTAELWHNTSSNTYSGFVYFIYSVGTNKYNVYVDVFNNQDKLIGQSPNILFNSIAGDIEIPPFSAENAKPEVQIIGNDTTVSIYDTIHITCIATDPIGSRGISKWELDINGEGFKETSTGDTSVIVPDVTGQRNGDMVYVVRVTDNDGNTSSDQITVTVVKDEPIASTFVEGQCRPSFLVNNSDSMIVVGDTVILHGTATDGYGHIVKWEWDIGNTGTFVTDESATDTSKYEYVIPMNSDSVIECVLRVTDDDGNTALDTVTLKVLFLFNGEYKIKSKNQSTMFGKLQNNVYQYHWFPLPPIDVSFSYDFWFDTTTYSLGNYFEAIKYCNEKSKGAGLDTAYTYTDSLDIQMDLTKNGFRISTEAEFHYAFNNGVVVLGEIRLNDKYENAIPGESQTDYTGPSVIDPMVKFTMTESFFNRGNYYSYFPTYNGAKYLLVRTVE